MESKVGYPWAGLGRKEENKSRDGHLISLDPSCALGQSREEDDLCLLVQSPGLEAILVFLSNLSDI